MQYSIIATIFAAAVVSAQPLVPALPSLPVGKYAATTSAPVYPVQTTTLAKVYYAPTTSEEVYYAQTTSAKGYYPQINPAYPEKKYPEVKEPYYPSLAEPALPISSAPVEADPAVPSTPALAKPAAPSLSADGNNVCPVNSAVSCCNTEASPFNVLGGSCTLNVLALNDQCAPASSYCCQTTPSGLINVDLSCTPITI